MEAVDNYARAAPVAARSHLARPVFAARDRRHLRRGVVMALMVLVPKRKTSGCRRSLRSVAHSLSRVPPGRIAPPVATLWVRASPCVLGGACPFVLSPLRSWRFA